MKIEKFVSILDSEFYTGVPDSQLKGLCNYLIYKYGINNNNHIIAANEGNCVAIAAGYHLATGKIPVVYMQNSGEGNIINPVVSLMNENVYGIPCVFVIGWRGEPGVDDEPQHIYQGRITKDLLDDMDIDSYIINKDTTEFELSETMNKFKKLLAFGKQVAFIVRKSALEFERKIEFSNNNLMKREDIIKHIVNVTGDDLIVSTTGKASRELFEIRERKKQRHSFDFLTVGSMGHASSIAFGIALQKPEKTIWVIDGDGSCLMHMGAMALIGVNKPKNFKHIVINNGSHETVGGQPTVASLLDLSSLASDCGYSSSFVARNFEELDSALHYAKIKDELTFIEVKCGIGARENLGRPTISAKENKEDFMKCM